MVLIVAESRNPSLTVIARSIKRNWVTSVLSFHGLLFSESSGSGTIAKNCRTAPVSRRTSPSILFRHQALVIWESRRYSVSSADDGFAKLFLVRKIRPRFG